MSQTKAIVDTLLSNVSSMYVPTGLIAEELLPEIKSKSSTGKLGKYGSNHLRIEKSLKGGRAAYRRVEGVVRETLQYSIEGHGLEGMVTKDDYRNTNLPFKAEEDETTAITSMLLIEKEKTLADILGNTSIVSQNVTLVGGDQLNNYGTSLPLDVFGMARSAVRAAAGGTATVAVMDWAVYNKLRFHPTMMLSLGFNYARPGGLKEDEIATALDVDRVLVAKGMYNSAKEGQPDNLVPIWGKDILFGVFPDTAQPMQVSGGYLVTYEDDTPRKVYKYDINNPPESTGILVEDNYDMLISNVGALFLIKNAIA